MGADLVLPNSSRRGRLDLRSTLSSSILRPLKSVAVQRGMSRDDFSFFYVLSVDKQTKRLVYQQRESLRFEPHLSLQHERERVAVAEKAEDAALVSVFFDLVSTESEDLECERGRAR